MEVNKQLDSLDYLSVMNFICTLDNSCRDSAEFSEWSNELIFKLIEEDINVLNGVLHELGYRYVLLVARELENPLLDYDLVKIYEVIKRSEGRAPKDMIEEE
ncbi:MAG: hypothetical protein LPK19_17710, partial [Hymenobacteraceae bacterium]|nr:hypothetical protein [Hymenobacteraceae bacterium]MDX5514165.1 hypothetical protein [Hymenobacteraceae bacterium]